jgi:hypothetical protein
MLRLRSLLAAGLMTSLATFAGCQPPQPAPDVDPVVTPASPNMTADEVLAPSANTTADEALAPSPNTTGDEAVTPPAETKDTTTSEAAPTPAEKPAP